MRTAARRSKPSCATEKRRSRRSKSSSESTSRVRNAAVVPGVDAMRAHAARAPSASWSSSGSSSNRPHTQPARRETMDGADDARQIVARRGRQGDEAHGAWAGLDEYAVDHEHVKMYVEISEPNRCTKLIAPVRDPWSLLRRRASARTTSAKMRA